MIKVLIIGRNGQVGWELSRTMAPLAELTCVDFPEVELSSEASLRGCVRAAQPQVIVNAAAYTAVDKAETEPELANKINGFAPGILASEAAQSGALLVHYSTDYVYDGTKASAYVEEDAPNPLSAYGRTKLAGDMAVMQSGCRYLIFRLCWVYGARGNNFLRTMMRLASEREQLRVVADQVGCPTWSRMIAEGTTMAVRQLLSTSGDARAYNGVYHMAASGHTSWHGFASEIINAMPAATRKCSNVQAITTAEYPLPARRPARSVLGCDKLERVFGLRLPDWKESLRKVLET